MCACLFISWLSSPTFLYPFTQPLSAPVLGACPGFRQGSVCSQPWQPAMLLSLAPFLTILETSQLFAHLPYSIIPLKPDWVPEGQQRRTGPDRDTLNLFHQHISRFCLKVTSFYKALGRRWRQNQGELPQHNVISLFAALGHEIKGGIHCRHLKWFLWSLPMAASCLKSLTSPPFLWECYQSIKKALKTSQENTLKSM